MYIRYSYSIWLFFCTSVLIGFCVFFLIHSKIPNFSVLLGCIFFRALFLRHILIIFITPFNIFYKSTYRLNTDCFVLRTLAILRKFAPVPFGTLCSFSFGRPIVVFAAASRCFADCSPALIDKKGAVSKLSFFTCSLACSDILLI